MELNSQEYWEKRFKEDDWDKEKGDKQTYYFATLAADMLPEWFIKNIMKHKYNICDLGCAEGDAIPVLQKIFKKSDIIGIDVSEAAIKRAEKKYLYATFKVGNIFENNGKDLYDVVYCSNVIEHFPQLENTLKHVCSFSKKYTIIMCPLREDFEVPEHEITIDTKEIPCVIEDNFLIFAKSVIGDINYYGGEQILLIYSKDIKDEEIASLGDLTDEVRSIAYNQSEAAWKSINDELYLANEKIKNMQENYKTESQFREELKEEFNSRLSEQVKDLKKDIDNRNEFWLEIQKRIVEGREEKLFEQKQIQEEIDLLNQNKRELEASIAQLDSNYIMQSKELIEKVMQSKSYMMILYFRRFIDQLLRGSVSEKKDFLKFSFSRAFRKNYNCKGSQNFDLLSTAQIFLSKLQYEKESINKIEQGKSFKDISLIKNTGQIFIFTGVPFYDVGGGQRCSQLTKVFDKLGYEVHYIYAYESSESQKFQIFNPALSHIYLGNLSEDKILDIIRTQAIFIFEAPFSGFLPYLELGNRCGIPTIYEHIDNWETSLGCLLYDKDSFDVFLENSDYLVATSKELVKQLERYTSKHIEYLPNAVDINVFEPSYKVEEPKDLVYGKNKTLLYFGSLWGEWFDWELLEKVAKNTPDCAYNLIGDYAAIEDKIKSLPSNIYFLGMKKQIELPGYLKYSDIAILPFKNCEIGKYVSPLKIFEYIAMGKFVLSEPLPDVLNYPNTLCSDQAEDWIKAINGEITIEKYDDFVSRNSWYDRCEKLIKLANSYYIDVAKYIKKISVIVLNYNNDKVIHRCVNSLLLHNSRYQYEVIVVDNGSSDGSPEKLKNDFGNKIKYIQSDRNGCAHGRNLGVENASGDYIVFLDSDQWVVSDLWLDAGLWILENRKSVGAVSWGAGWFTSDDCRGPIVDYFENRAISSENLYRSDMSYLATSGMLMKKKIFEIVGGFDRFYDPTCFEDTDLSLAINHYGLQTVYCPYLNIMHLPHQTTESGSKKHTELFNRNSKYFIEKWEKKNQKLFEKMFSHNV